MGFILFIHIVACVLLVIAVLMQAGRGGGLTETFQSAENMFGTQTNVFLVRTTSILAVIFLSTSLFLAVYSSKGKQSLMSDQKLLSTVPKSAAAPAAQSPDNDVQVKVEAPKAMAPAQSTQSAQPASTSKEVPASPVTNAAQ